MDIVSLPTMIWHNGQIKEGELEKYPASTDKGWIYEVLRVIESTPVFLEEHLNRFWDAGRTTDLPLSFPREELIVGFFDIIGVNNVKSGNIRLQADLALGNTMIGFIPHKYPTEEDYQAGVNVCLTELQRENPEIKTWNKDVRISADQIIRNLGVYETILTSPEGFIQEGSRSNIFGIRKGILITPPSNTVLPGITRMKIIELAGKINMPVREEKIHKEELYTFQSFFLTGTSPGILPIKSIGSIQFNCKSFICNNLRQSYRNEIQMDITKTKQLFSSR